MRHGQKWQEKQKRKTEGGEGRGDNSRERWSDKQNNDKKRKLRVKEKKILIKEKRARTNNAVTKTNWQANKDKVKGDVNSVIFFFHHPYRGTSEERRDWPWPTLERRDWQHCKEVGDGGGGGAAVLVVVVVGKCNGWCWGYYWWLWW